MTGPGIVSTMLETYAESPARVRSGFAAAMTGKPASCSPAMVLYQPDASANTPWTRTTVGLAPPAAGLPPAADAEGSAPPRPSAPVPAASMPPRTRRRG